MIVFPPCKINLGLFVTEKRKDGFHNIESIFIPVQWCDVLEVVESPENEFSFQSSGNFIDSSVEDNIVVKAFRLLQKDFNLPEVSIHLHKIIPAGAGLGGGSSDGAYMLRLLNELFNCGISDEDLRKYAAILGSDCPFFTQNEVMLVAGRGDIMERIDWPLRNKFIVIVHPAIHISTKKAYEGLKPKFSEVSLSTLVQKPMSMWSTYIKNDFEENAISEYPAIGAIKDKLLKLGALYASMSGSGSSVFGLFDQPVEVGNLFPGMTSWFGPVGPVTPAP